MMWGSWQNYERGHRSGLQLGEIKHASIQTVMRSHLHLNLTLYEEDYIPKYCSVPLICVIFPISALCGHLLCLSL